MLPIYILGLLISVFIPTVYASDKLVENLAVSSLEQKVDDEEAPFDIHSSNKVHNCGGKPSNVYRVYSEYDAVAMRRFQLAIEALKNNMKLSLLTDGCEDRVLKVKSLRLGR